MVLFFGAAMPSLAGATLVWRGSFLDRLWALSAGTYQRLAPIGGVAGVAFLVLGAVLLIAGAGWFFRRFWGWGLAAALVGTETVRSVANAIVGAFWKGAAGSLFAGAMLGFLSTSVNCSRPEGLGEHAIA